MYTIIRREAFSDTTFLWEVAVPDVAKSAEPGHFVMIRPHEGSERIPLTVADHFGRRQCLRATNRARRKRAGDVIGNNRREAEMEDRPDLHDSGISGLGPFGHSG